MVEIQDPTDLWVEACAQASVLARQVVVRPRQERPAGGPGRDQHGGPETVGDQHGGQKAAGMGNQKAASMGDQEAAGAVCLSTAEGHSLSRTAAHATRSVAACRGAMGCPSWSFHPWMKGIPGGPGHPSSVQLLAGPPGTP